MYNLQPTQNKLNGTSFMVYSDTYCLEYYARSYLLIIDFKFYKKRSNTLYGLSFMKTYILHKYKNRTLHNPI